MKNWIKWKLIANGYKSQNCRSQTSNMENKHAEISEYKNMTLMRIPEHEEENNDE